MNKKSLTIIIVGLIITSNIHIISASTGVPTGDDTKVMPYIVLLLATAIGGGALYWFKKKKQ